MNKFELGIGHTTVRAHDRINRRDVTPVVTLNYVSPDHRLPLPYPEGDWYLRNTAVPAARPGEVVICNTLIPGLTDYYIKVGLLSDAMTIVEVEPENRPGYGFPGTDPLARLKGQVMFADHGNTLPLVSTFSNEMVSQQQRALGLEDLQRPDSAYTNDKAHLRLKADSYGIRMLPGEVVNDWKIFEQLESEYSNLPNGVWMKAPTGSGGDLVFHIPSVSTENLLEGRDSIRNAVMQAFERGEFLTSGEEYWPHKAVAPAHTQLVIESDARNHGEILINGSTQFVTIRNGAMQLVGHFEQITTEEGEYLGNRPYKPNEIDEENILDQVSRVSQLSKDEGYYGIQGVDWFLIKTPQGETITYIVERNARPTANTPPVIIADKFNAPSWINTNVYTDTPIETIDDYINVIGQDLAYGDPEGNGLVIPQAFRTKITRRGVDPSSNFKILIMGSTPEHCDKIAQGLTERGLRFTP